MSTAALVLSAAALTVVEHSMEAMLPWMQAVVRAEVASTLAAQREAPRSAKKSRKRVRFQQYDFSTVSLPQDTVRDSEHACETVAVALEPELRLLDPIGEEPARGRHPDVAYLLNDTLHDFPHGNLGHGRIIEQLFVNAQALSRPNANLGPRPPHGLGPAVGIPHRCVKCRRPH